MRRASPHILEFGLTRLTRFSIPGVPQHITQRGNNRQDVFRGEQDYLLFLRRLMESASTCGCQVHSYVLMTNHIHLLATPVEWNSIGRLMKSVTARYSRYFNTKYDRTGTLWEGRYRATVIDSEEYFLTCSRYIEQNPVRAGMVGDPGEYRWSSYRHKAWGLGDSIVRESDLYLRLGASPGERQLAYRDLLAAMTPEDALAAIREATSKSWALGGKEFVRSIGEAAGRRPRPLPRGKSKLVSDTNSTN